MDQFIINREWASRPADERFPSKDALLTYLRDTRARSRAAVVSSRALRAIERQAGELLAEAAP